MRRRHLILTVGGLAVIAGLAAGGWWWRSARPGDVRPAAYVGSASCAGCHAEAERRWRGSHHDLAMQPATETSVAGDFNDTRFTYAGVTTTFSRRDGKFLVRTDGPDGALADYEIAYTFGVSPLQQYLVPFPDGRLQALSIAWDTRPRAQGGQRWFHLYPNAQVTHRHELHWTGPSQNWNYMCADCHSTALRKGYDANARRFATTYAEVNVACEACHGPGGDHVAWARRGSWGRLDAGKGLAVALDERRGVTWTIAAATGTASRRPAGRPARELSVCGRCHARRGQLTDAVTPGRPLGDAYRVALLDDRLYHPDGQIRDEVYEYGSFLQSKMFDRGVTCSDCHDPHSGRLRASGGQVCLRCHAAEKYQTPRHHFHAAADSRGADCVGCHMPSTTYMVVDPRHDHSFRIPRPDLSLTLGLPNACTRCHAERPAAWAAQQVEAWYGRPSRGHQKYAEALQAGSVGAPGSSAQLLAVARDGTHPAIARASALARLPADPSAPDAVRASLKDADPLVRRAAARAIEGVEPALRVELAAPLLEDAVRDVRLEAALVLAGVPPHQLTQPQRAALERGLAEYVAAQRFNADRADSHLNLGLLYAIRQRPVDAEAALQTALELDPGFAPAAVNLADLYRATGRDADGERVLRAALARDPRAAAAHHALGLLLIRQKRAPEAVAELEAAARLAPESARYGFVHAVALHDVGQPRQAREALARVLARHPYDRDALSAAVTYALEQGDAGQALADARRLAELEPGNADLRRLIERLDTSRPERPR
jgi:predicted CXXCH cytochrome family protein